MIRRSALATVALFTALAPPAASTAAPRPAPYVDAERGFQLVLPEGWLRVEQDTGATATAAPVFKAANDRAGSWMVVVLNKGPTDDAGGEGKAALANFEAGFAEAPGYQRLSIQRREVAPAKPPRGARTPASSPKPVPAIDLWFTMERDGKPVVVGARSLLFRSYALTLVVDAPGKKIPRPTRRLLESFQPSAPGG